LLVFWVKGSLQHYSIAAASLNVVAAFGFLALVTVTHTRTIRPSTLVTVYLIGAIISSISSDYIIRSKFGVSLLSWLLTASVTSKALLLCLDQKDKDRILKLGVEYSPEETSGILSRIVFWWLVPFFRKGYTTILNQEDLYPLADDLRTERLASLMNACWGKRKLDVYTTTGIWS
jgi:ATP-binding cassette subfamily C (CFTR/MRP) protein 1